MFKPPKAKGNTLLSTLTQLLRPVPTTDPIPSTLLHIGLGEDSLALLVRGQLELRLGDTVRDLLEECLLLGVGAVGAELADERGRVGRLADLVAQAAVEYVRIPTYSIFC